MTETIKNGEFVEIEYVGTIKETNVVFDTTSDTLAQKHNIYNPYAQYGPSIVCIGQHQLLAGLDETLPGKEIGKEYSITVSPGKGFGNKSPELLKMVPLNSFKDPRPISPGIRVDIDGNQGVVKTISGGRVVVDFNHPLAGKELVYSIKALKVVTDDTEKVKSLISLTLNLKKRLIDITLTNGKATVVMMKLPELFQKEFAKKIISLVPTVKEVVFEEKKT